MVRTGARAAALALALEVAGLQVADTRPPVPRLAALPADVRAAIAVMYVELGGQQGGPAIRAGAWDLALKGGLVVELDEELHFNRYRAQTLTASWMRELPWTDAYRVMCADYEASCVRAGSWGKRWTSESCERMFGPAAPAALLDEPGGSPRWKQRALHDAVKDAVASLPGAPRVVRLSVHDVLDGVPLGAVLEGHRDVAPNTLRTLVERRVA